jgi:transcriptional regulator of acetoin/glycerol metabolism
VRELENALEFAATVAQGQTLQPEDLPPEILGNDGAADVAGARDHPPARSPAGWPPGLPRATAPRGARTGDRGAILHALEAHAWNRVDAASALGMSRSTLWRRMRALGLE